MLAATPVRPKALEEARLLPADRHPSRILIVVANPQMRKALERAVTAHGHEARLTCDPQEADMLAGEYLPHLCVIDVVHGNQRAIVELIGRLRARDPAANLIIIDDRCASEASGAPAYEARVLRRPFSMLEFIAAVDDVL
jgi:DNA-binding response OmpR family regulator